MEIEQDLDKEFGRGAGNAFMVDVLARSGSNANVPKEAQAAASLREAIYSQYTALEGVASPYGAAMEGMDKALKGMSDEVSSLSAGSAGARGDTSAAKARAEPAQGGARERPCLMALR